MIWAEGDARSFGIYVDSLLRSEEHTSELQSQSNLVCRLLLEKKKTSSQNKVYFATNKHCFAAKQHSFLTKTLCFVAETRTKLHRYIIGVLLMSTTHILVRSFC